MHAVSHVARRPFRLLGLRLRPAQAVPLPNVHSPPLLPLPAVERRMASDAPPGAKDASGVHVNTTGLLCCRGAGPCARRACPRAPCCSPACSLAQSAQRCSGLLACICGASMPRCRLPAVTASCHSQLSSPEQSPCCARARLTPATQTLAPPCCRLRLRAVQRRPVAVRCGFARRARRRGVP